MTETTTPTETSLTVNPAPRISSCYARLYPYGISHATSNKSQASQHIAATSSPEIVIYNFSGDVASLNYCLNKAKNEFEFIMRLICGYRLTYAFSVVNREVPITRNRQRTTTNAYVVRFVPCSITQSVSFAPGGSQGPYTNRAQRFHDQLQEKRGKKKLTREDLFTEVSIDRETLEKLNLAAAKWSKVVLDGYINACKQPSTCWVDLATDPAAVERWFNHFLHRSNIGVFDLEAADALERFSIALDF